MSEPEKPELPPARLELRQTMLRVEEGELVRRNDAGGVVMTIPLDDVESMQFVREWNGFVAWVMLGTAGLVAIGLFVSESNTLSVCLYVVALFMGLFGLSGLRGDVIEIKARGETVRVSCAEPTDQVKGFAASLAGMVGGR